jgi:hypothetical protein
MADYFTHFYCVLEAGTPEKAVQALDLHTRLCAEDESSDDPTYTGFALALQDGPGTSVLWFHDDGQGDVEAVIAFVLRLAPEIDLTGLWGFDYAHTCSRPRLEAFGGGAHVIDLGGRKSIGWISTHEWLTAALSGEDIEAVEALVQ